MGGGSYSYDDRRTRAVSMDYYSKSVDEIFTSRGINEAMIPRGVKIRESRDSAEHPNSFPIIIGLDVTGSMQSIPHHLVKDGFPDIMKKVMESGIKDPQVLFLAIGDHKCDNAPLQVGQFESSDELLDKWLTNTWLEGKGGGNGGESYLLAWYFAGYHTAIDSYEKRNEKGVLITIGDEPTHRSIPQQSLKNIMGEAEAEFSYQQLLEKASDKYEVYHLHVTSTRNGSDSDVQNGWKEIMGDRVIMVDNHEKIPNIISELVLKHSVKYDNGFILNEKATVKTDVNKPTEILL